MLTMVPILSPAIYAPEGGKNMKRVSQAINTIDRKIIFDREYLYFAFIMAGRGGFLRN